MSLLGRVVGSGEAPPLSINALARSGGLLYGSGAVFVLVSLVVERTPGTKWLIVGPALGVAFLVAVILLLIPTAFPPGFFPYLTAAGTLMITLVAYADGAASSPVVLLYVWAAVYAFYFYSVATALAETAWISASAGVELWIRAGFSNWFSHWLLLTGTCLVGGLVVRQLVAQVRSEGGRDPLTGLYNRRTLLEHLDRDRRRAERTAAPLSIVMLDLDGLKALNDRLGHLEGDRYLREVAASWSRELRGGDVIARFGGDEFIVVMPDCTLQRACAVADRLRAVTPGECTASAGAAQWMHGTSVDTLIGAADMALYRAKLAGRNRTEAAFDAATLWH